MHAYTNLTDHVFYQMLQSSDKNLEKASTAWQFIDRYFTNNVHYCFRLRNYWIVYWKGICISTLDRQKHFHVKNGSTR